MKTAKDLTREELERVITTIQQTLWPAADPDAEWSSDEIEDVASVLINHGLGPDDCEEASDDRG